MKAFFKYQFKKSVIPFIVMAVCLAVVSLFQLIGEKSISRAIGGVSYTLAIFVIFCILFPAWIYSYQMKSRSVDLYYSLPLSKIKQLLVRYVVGLATLLAAFTVVFWLETLILAVKFPGSFVYFMQLYFALLLPAWALYSISSYAFTRANSLLDGFVYIALFHFALFIVVLFLTTLFSWGDIGEEYLSFGPIIVITNYILGKMKYVAFGYKYPPDDINNHQLAAMIIIGIIAVICTAALFVQEKYKKAENCNQISNGIIGYKTLLPIYIVCICTFFVDCSTWWVGIDDGIADDLSAFATFVAKWCNHIAQNIGDLLMTVGITAVASYLCYALYTRSFKIGVKNAIVIAICIAASLILGITAYFI